MAPNFWHKRARLGEALNGVSGAVWQAGGSLALFLVVFARTAPLRVGAVQLDQSYRLASADGVVLLIPPYTPGVEAAASLVPLYAGRPLAYVIGALGLSNASIAGLLATVALIFAMTFAAGRLLMLPRVVSHIAAWLVPLLLIGGTPLPPFGYFGLSADAGAAIGAAAGLLAIGFLYRLGLAATNRQVGVQALGFATAAIIAAGLTPFGAAFIVTLWIAGAALALTASSRTAALRMSTAAAVVIIIFVVSIRGHESALRALIYAHQVSDQSLSGMLSLLLGRSPLTATAFAALLFAGIVAGAVCVAWGKGSQRAIGGVATFGIVLMAVVLFFLGIRNPQFRTVDFRILDIYLWPFVVFALASALDIVAALVAGGAKRFPAFSRALSLAVLLAVAVLAMTMARHRTGIDERESYWLNAANSQSGSWLSPADSFSGYTFALPPVAVGEAAAPYTAAGFRSDKSPSNRMALAAETLLNPVAQTLMNFARRADDAGAREPQLAGLLANWGVTGVVANKAPMALPTPNLNGFSPYGVASIAEPAKALAWLAENGFGRRDWVVSASALPERLSPARNVRLTKTGNSFRATGEADGPALVVLPIGYDPCRMRLVANGASAPENPRLVLVNLAQAGIFFNRRLDATIDAGQLYLQSAECQQAAKARLPEAPPNAKPAPAGPRLLDLALPASLTVSTQAANGGAAAVKIVNFAAYDVAKPEVPLPKHPDQLPAYAIDGDAATFWSTAMMSQPQLIHIQLDFEMASKVDRVTLMGRQAHQALLAVPDQVEVSDDGITWQATPMKAAQSGYFIDVTFEPVTGRFLRLRMSQGNYMGSYYDQIAEVFASYQDPASKTLALAWRNPLGAVAGLTLTDYRLRWSARPETGVDCANCRITGVPMPAAGAFGVAESALVSPGILPKEAQFVSVLGIDVDGKVLAVSNAIPIR